MTSVLAFSSRRVHERRDSQITLSVDELVDHVHLIFRNAGIGASQSKVRRLVRDYKDRVEGNGFAFIDYLVNSFKVSSLQRRVIADELTRVIAYSDPTGEMAVNNVLRGKR